MLHVFKLSLELSWACWELHFFSLHKQPHLPHRVVSPVSPSPWYCALPEPPFFREEAGRLLFLEHSSGSSEITTCLLYAAARNVCVCLAWERWFREDWFWDIHLSPSFVASPKYRMRINHPVTFQADTFMNYEKNSSLDNWQSPYGI